MSAISIKKRFEFLRIQKRGRRSRTDLAVVLGHLKSKKYGRLGLTASKAIGKAHQRNLVKRRLRHIFQQHPELLANHDMVVIVNEKAPKASHAELEQAILSAVERLKFSVPSKPVQKSGNPRRSHHDKRSPL